ncbi:MAG: glutamine synthetase family protein [Minisyncoccia bacterium]
MKTTKEIEDIVKSEGISFIQCFFTDILGNLKSFSITPLELKEALEEGMGFDGSSIEGFARIEESDMIAKPDPDTFQIIPWKVGEHRSAFMICDILNPNGSHYAGDPRFALKRSIDEARKPGFTFYTGPELEYFYFKDMSNTAVIDRGGYFDGKPIDLGEETREKTAIALQKMGIKVEYSHHEVAPSQHEIDLKYMDALKMADTVMIYRFTVKEIARQSGLYATFMPKPINGENGSGMHVHQSLFMGDKNAFHDSADKYHLSPVAKSYIAGILKHSTEITAICNQWVNSYKRLIPGFEAPVYISWARRNRSALVRVPMYKPNKEKATRIELRSPDPACNPYLAFTAMLTAGLLGIKEKYKLSDPVEEDIYEMSPEKRKEHGIESLPENLGEAIKIMEKSKLLKDSLGDHIFSKFLANKKIEWDRFRTHVSKFETDKYLPVL